MPMRKAQRNELRKLRELVRSLLEDKKCCFCKAPLITGPLVKIGSADGAPVRGITIHHNDGDHGNDEKKNRRYVHCSCHKSFHMKQGWKNGQFKKEKGE